MAERYNDKARVRIYEPPAGTMVVEGLFKGSKFYFFNCPGDNWARFNSMGLNFNAKPADEYLILDTPGNRERMKAIAGICGKEPPTKKQVDGLLAMLQRA